MKKQILPSVLLLVSLLLTACYRNDIRTETFQIDQLRTEQDVQQVAKALQKLTGIKEIRPGISARTLTVVFDGRQLYLKNIESAIVNAGYSLPHWPAKKAVKNKPTQEK